MFPLANSKESTSDMWSYSNYTEDDNDVDNTNFIGREYYVATKTDDFSNNMNGSSCTDMIDCANSSDNNETTIRNSSTMFGALLTSLVALYVGMNRFTFLVMMTEQHQQQQESVHYSSSSSSSMAACTLVIVFACFRKVWNDRVSTITDCVLLKSTSSTNITINRIKSSVSVSASTSMMRLVDSCSNNVLVRTLNESKNNLFEYGSSIHNKQQQQAQKKHLLQPTIAIQNGSFVSSTSSLLNIEELSLHDIKILFQYMVHVNHFSDNDTESIGTTRDQFLSQVTNQYCRDAIYVLDHVVKSALKQQQLGGQQYYSQRNTDGFNSCLSIETNTIDISFGQCSALYFVAVVCIFAEWRTIRLVPKDKNNQQNQYKRYAIGMGLARRDLIQNASKIEHAVYQYIQECIEQRNMTNGSIACQQGPTIQQLLQWEIYEKHVHGKHLPKVREKSCASGLLWIYRQIVYQNHIFQNIIQVGTTKATDNNTILFPTAKSAVVAAYHATYDTYHGFIVKQIMTSSLDAAPSNHIELLMYMIPPSSTHRQKQKHKSSNINNVNNIDTSDCNVISNKEEINNKRSVALEQTTISSEVAHDIVVANNTICVRQDIHLNPLNMIVRHCVSEWMKLERFMNQCNGRQNRDEEQRYSNNHGLIVPTNGRSTLDLSNIQFNDVSRIIQQNSDRHVIPKSQSTTSLEIHIDDNDRLIRAAKEDIQAFHITIEPILNQMKTLIDNFNINDPAKC